MKAFRILVPILCCVFSVCKGQGNANVWSLTDCINYAVTHNISIKQDSLNARLARFTLRQSQLSQIPTVNANGSYGKSFGRSINPTTNQFVEGSYTFLSASGSAQANIFSGLQTRYNIARNRLTLAAALADLDQLRDDVSLNVANAFLAAVLAKEQIGVSKNQVSLTTAQLDQTKAFATTGRLPELNVAQLESQLATDSANLINSLSSYNASILDLKALLNLDFDTPFEIAVPEVNADEAFATKTVSREEVFQSARAHFGSVRGALLRVSAAEKGLAAAKGGMYPQLTAGYQAGTNYASNFQSITGYTVGAPENTGAFAVDTLNNRQYWVFSQSVSPRLKTLAFNTQFETNLRHSIFVGLDIPILNGWQTNLGIKQAQINLYSQQLSADNAELTLRQNVYKAHNNAVNAVQKYLAAKRAEQAAARATDFAKKRYDLGLTTTVDLLVTQNAQFAASSNLAIAKYDLIFKLKVIDYYLGRELKL